MDLLRALLAGLAVLLTAAPTLADPQTDLVTPTGWWWMTDTTVQAVEDKVAEGFRIVDIEVESVSPFRLSAAFVRNSGPYQKNWWWLTAAQPAGLDNFLGQNNARLIDVEPYQTPTGEVRYAVVMIPNAGSDYYVEHGWLRAYTSSDLHNWVTDNPDKRIIDLQLMGTSGIQTYAAIWVNNTGARYTDWWWLAGVPASTLASELTQNQARLIDLELNGSPDRVSAVMLPRDGNGFYWLRGLRFEEVDHVAQGYATRIIDLERYETSSGEYRFAVVLRRNDNELTVQTAYEMRQHLTPEAINGFLLREIGEGSFVRAGVQEDRVFEPASLLKTIYHFTAMRTISIGADSLNSQVIEETGLQGSCPDGTGPVSRPLETVLRTMMEASSNTAAAAVVSRYGPLMIESVAGAFGAVNVGVNHTIGCGCTPSPNEVTLTDLANVHDAVADGVLGEFEEDFYRLMPNVDEFGMGGQSTSSLLATSLAASSLSAAERSAFLELAYYAHKPGGYNCASPNDPDYFRCRGAYVRLPFRSECGVELREFFIGAWVEEVDSIALAEEAAGAGMVSLFEDVLQKALSTWESSNCPSTQNYCQANPNSTGEIGRTIATGPTTVASNSLVIRGSQFPLNTLGYLLVSDAEGFVANPGNSAGNLCLGGQFGRYAGNIKNSGPNGVFAQWVDLNNIPFPSMPAQVQIGDSLFFQWWHRDTDPAGPSSNLSEGLRVNFL